MCVGVTNETGARIVLINDGDDAYCGKEAAYGQ